MNRRFSGSLNVSLTSPGASVSTDFCPGVMLSSSACALPGTAENTTSAPAATPTADAFNGPDHSRRRPQCRRVRIVTLIPPGTGVARPSFSR
ncbi:hypothetical protein GCM10010468_03800 [Actinocorallia longicatena]|uniref:Uncharacterized protein n=1 Tax=Actinocorallia longicatena TaxID=111803 RepID=A0ABP6PXI3_9ACTN